MEEHDPLKAKKLLEQSAAREALSFQSLIKELGDLPEGAGTGPPPAGGTGFGDFSGVSDGDLLERDFSDVMGTMDGDGEVRPRARKVDEMSFRVLSESAPKGTPVWLQALFTGGLSVLLLLPVFFRSAMAMHQPWFSYGIMFLGGSTIFWSVYGMTRNDEPKNRWLCLIGLFLGTVAAAAAYMLRMPPGMR